MTMLRVLCIGELLVDLCAVDTDVRLAEVETFVRVPGGAPANVAVGTARLGCQAGFIGAVGADFFGQFLTSTLAANGVDTTHVTVTGEARTTLAFIANHADGHKEIEFYRRPGADMHLTERAVSESYVAAFDVVHFGSISLIDEGPRAATLRARDLAAARGALTTCDVNWRPSLWPDLAVARDRIRDGVAGVSVVKLSDEEWTSVLGTADFDAGVRSLFERGVSLVVRTEGADGARFATAAVRGHMPAFRVAPIDPLGAGDAFMAGLIQALGGLAMERGRDLGSLTTDQLAGAMRAANAAGALATLKRGAMSALPDAQELQRFMSSAVSV